MEIAEINLSHISYSECKGFFQPLSNKKKIGEISVIF